VGLAAPGVVAATNRDDVLHPLDETLFRALFGHGETGALRTLALAFSALGGGWCMLTFVPLLFAPRARRFAVWLLAVLVGTALVVYLVKMGVGRQRPYLACADLAHRILHTPTDPSFPSGHAAGSFAFALFTAHALLDRAPRPRFALATAVACVLFAACVGASRVVLGAHFPGDVVSGAILGATIGGLAGRRFTASRARRL
jgi:undecaprenyl-diphosphatase